MAKPPFIIAGLMSNGPNTRVKAEQGTTYNLTTMLNHVCLCLSLPPVVGGCGSGWGEEVYVRLPGCLQVGVDINIHPSPKCVCMYGMVSYSKVWNGMECMYVRMVYGMVSYGMV